MRRLEFPRLVLWIILRRYYEISNARGNFAPLSPITCLVLVSGKFRPLHIGRRGECRKEKEGRKNTRKNEKSKEEMDGGGTEESNRRRKNNRNRKEDFRGRNYVYY